MAVSMASSCSNFGLYTNLKQPNSRASSFFCSFGLDPLQLPCIHPKKRYFLQVFFIWIFGNIWVCWSQKKFVWISSYIGLILPAKSNELMLLNLLETFYFVYFVLAFKAMSRFYGVSLVNQSDFVLEFILVEMVTIKEIGLTVLSCYYQLKLMSL